MNQLIDHLWPYSAFVISMAMGLLIGLERERSSHAKAGLRTFALVAVCGTLGAMLSKLSASAWPLGAGLIMVGAMIIAPYVVRPNADDPGTTTVAAVLVCYGLGALIWYDKLQLAVTLAILTTLLLYFKSELSKVSHQLTRTDLLSLLQFAVLSLVILPILPDEGFGPYHAVNPRQVWWMVVLISGVSLVGYAALRLAGQRNGALLTGLLGGLASSTATTLTFARHGKHPDTSEHQAAFVILLANGVVFARLAVVIGVLAPDALRHALPVLAMGGVSGSLVLIWLWRQMRVSGVHKDKIDTRAAPATASAEATAEAPPHAELKVSNPGELRTALTFGALYAAVLSLAAWLTDTLGQQGVFALAAVSGLTDVDAITLTALRLFNLNELTTVGVTTIVVIANASNMAFKSGLVMGFGGQRLARLVVPSMVWVVGVMTLTWWLMRAWAV